MVSPNVALGEADHSDGGNGRRDKAKATMALTRPCPASHRNMLFANGIGFLTGRRERVRLAATLLTCPPIGGHREVRGGGVRVVVRRVAAASGSGKHG